MPQMQVFDAVGFLEDWIIFVGMKHENKFCKGIG